jgi:predicted outer membrane repeat protein
MPMCVSKCNNIYVGLSPKIIYGNNVVIDGKGKYSGFKVGLGAFSGRSLSITDLTMERFCPYNDVSGDMGGKMDGGVILAKTCLMDYSNSTINFNNSIMNFTNNKAISAGEAIFAGKNSNIIFDSSEINFIDNRAHSFGGAICADRQSSISPEDASGMSSPTRITFSNSEITFENNRAVKGGGIYIDEYASMIFSRSIVNFTGNHVEYSGDTHGGAVYTKDSIVNFRDSTIGFINNRSLNN